MRALSLTQPWASLVACGAKSIETRSWQSPYRGPLAIHAAKAMPADACEFARYEPCYAALHAAQLVPFTWLVDDELRAALPRGAVIAVCRLIRCVAILPPELRSEWDTVGMPPEGSDERAFGDYAPGRWMWRLEDVVALPEPIPAKGRLGLWQWDAPAEVTALLQGGDRCRS